MIHREESFPLKNGVLNNGEGGETLGKSRHDRIVDRVASRYSSKHRREGVDIRVQDMAIEVAAELGDVYQSIHQLNSSRKKRKYLCVPREHRDRALNLLRGTGIGVMDGNGRIVKRSRG